MAGENSMEEILASIRKMIAEEPVGSRPIPQAAAASPFAPLGSQVSTAAAPGGTHLPSLEAVATAWGAQTTERTFGPAIGPQAGVLPKLDPDRNAAFPIARDGLAGLIDDTLEKPAMMLVRPSEAATAQPAVERASVDSGLSMTLPNPHAAARATDELSLTDRLLERLGAAASKPAAANVVVEPQTVTSGLAIDRPPLFATPPLGAVPLAVAPFDASARDLGSGRPELGDALNSTEPTLAALLTDELKSPTDLAPQIVTYPHPPQATGATQALAQGVLPSNRPNEPLPQMPSPFVAPPFAPVPLAAPTTPQGVEGGIKTLEDSVAEMMRPMLKTWLDANLPRIVEAAVRQHMASRPSSPFDKL